MAKLEGNRCSLHIWLLPEEMEKLKEQASSSIYKSMSAYARKLVTKKRVSIYYRNKSFDDFVDVAIELRNELRRIGEKNFFSPGGEEEFLQLVKHIQLAIDKLVDQCLQT